MSRLIALLPGDGVGPEIVAAARVVLAAVADTFGHDFEFREGLIGGGAIDATGQPLPAETTALCQASAGVLLGAVGGPQWSDPSAPVRPEQGLLALRRALGVFANLRPVMTLPALYGASPLKESLLDGVDILFVRELTGGIYFGAKQRDADRASDLCSYTREEIERVLRLAFETARARRGVVTSVDKANVLETSRLWREIATRLGREEFPDVKLEHALVDAVAMQLLQDPRRFDVVVTENMFGDILTDEASVLAGSIGMLPSASLAASGPGLYEPIHGSAPDIAGRGIANPCGTILSAAMLLRHSLGLEAEARAVEQATYEALGRGIGTVDVVGRERGSPTRAVGAAIAAAISEGPARAIA
ncbi:3-isopropylmalate dehydrogenase [Thioalkalivibrio sp. XN8]|uniref:3-isopropylmalate dehydrogenase n=1 Tax=Thioalkalivibrio sp. XN8 TaxID=2712863 RepID=UPI0013EDE61F|nr:3-isopropylmalate dehydrogenase [Thioalkalivibrio sp. XN8]